MRNLNCSTLIKCNNFVIGGYITFLKMFLPTVASKRGDITWYFVVERIFRLKQYNWHTQKKPTHGLN